MTRERNEIYRKNKELSPFLQTQFTMRIRIYYVVDGLNRRKRVEEEIFTNFTFIVNVGRE